MRRHASAVIVAARSATLPYRVLLMVRRREAKYLPGAAVFPGGAMDESDVSLGGGSLERGARVAAVRELLEEAGLAFPVAGEVWGDGVLKRARKHVLGRGGDVVKAMEELFPDDATGYLAKQANSLLPWSRFLAPRFEILQFDAISYLALPKATDEELVGLMRSSGAACVGVGMDALEEDLEHPAEDHEEAAALGWLHPSEALLMHSDGRIHLPPPQYMLCREMEERFPTFESLREGAKEAVYGDDGLPLTLRPVLGWAEVDDDVWEKAIDADVKVHGPRSSLSKLSHVPAVVLPGDVAYPVEERRGRLESDLNRLLFFPSNLHAPSKRWITFCEDTTSVIDTAKTRTIHDPTFQYLVDDGAALPKRRKEGVPVSETRFIYHGSSAAHRFPDMKHLSKQ